MLLGGWRETAQATDLTRQLNMDVVISSFIDGSVGRGHAAHGRGAWLHRSGAGLSDRNPAQKGCIDRTFDAQGRGDPPPRAARQGVGF